MFLSITNNGESLTDGWIEFDQVKELKIEKLNRNTAKLFLFGDSKPVYLIRKGHRIIIEINDNGGMQK